MHNQLRNAAQAMLFLAVQSERTRRLPGSDIRKYCGKERQMKLKALSLVFAVCASSAAADLIVINDRYVVPKEDVRGYFYRDRDSLTVFDIRWSDWSTQYRCADEYDRASVTAASLNLVVQMKDALSLDFGEFLESEGFTDCRKF